MEAKLKQESLRQYVCVYTDTIVREETAESVVPDTMPDIAQILDTDCTMYLRAKNIQNGKALIEGNLQAVILYMGEEAEGLFKLELTKPVVFSYENESLSEQDRLCLRLMVNNADTRILNPRKILLRADVFSELFAYRPDEHSMAVDREEEDGFIQILPAECTVQCVSNVGEKSFVLAEDFTFPGSRVGAEEVLTAVPWATVEEMKPVGEKMILQGTAGMKLLYGSKEGATLKTESVSTGFSQIMDCGENAAEPHTMILIPTAFHWETIDSGNGTTTVTMDLHLTAQLICRNKTTVRYLADAYSLNGAETVEYDSIPVHTHGETILLRETVRDVLECGDAVTEILDGSVRPGVPIVQKQSIHIPLNIRVLYRKEDGRIGSVYRRLQTEIPCDGLPDQRIYLYPARCSEGYFAPASNGVEVRLPLEIKVDRFAEQTLSCVKAVSVDTDAAEGKENAPSLVVVRCGDTDLWSLAKRYKTTVDRIRHANKNTVEIGQLLLIPRPR